MSVALNFAKDPNLKYTYKIIKSLGEDNRNE